MRPVFLVLVIIALHTNTLSQGKVAKEIGDLISKGDLVEAQRKVNAYLAADPHDVDALMMKGNMILNQSLATKSQIMVVANEDESIYSNSIGYIRGSQPSVLPEDVALKVVGVWQEALKYDNSREDIHLGICQIYSMAILTDQLIAYLPVLQAKIVSAPQLCYSMGDYARNMIAREHFEDAMRVYKAISRLYPLESGVVSDIAGEYYSHGDLDSARAYASLLLDQNGLDAMSCQNAFFILAISEDYDNALKALEKKCQLSNDREYLLYQGLVMLWREDPSWTMRLTDFLETPADSTQAALATSLLRPGLFTSLADYCKVEANEMSDAYKILLARIGKKLFPVECDPLFNYAEVLTHTNSYRKASAQFAEVEKSNLCSSTAASEKVAFFHGWVLWKLGERQSSVAVFSRLLKSQDFYYKSAAAYFVGKHYYDLGDRAKANSYFTLVSDKAAESKYATLCWNLLRN